MAKETNRIDIYQAVTDDILAMLEAGTKPWVKPWSGGPTIPLRHNGVAYRGINVLSLWASAMRQGFALPLLADLQTGIGAWRQCPGRAARGPPLSMLTSLS